MIGIFIVSVSCICMVYKLGKSFKILHEQSNSSRVLIEYVLVLYEGINSEIFNQALTLSNVKGPHLNHPGYSICHH